MSSIVRQKVGKHVYLYESISYRDAKGKPRNKRYPVGKIDPVTGNPIYKPEYLERMAGTGRPVSLPEQSSFSVEDIQRSKIREHGTFHLLHQVADKIGLLGALQESMPKHWKEVFVLASYMVVTADPFLYCEQWVADAECLPVGNMSSQRISDLLRTLTAEQRQNFYHTWCHLRSEQEYLALDITSISSYSQLIDDVEWGYNRNNDLLPQINLCLLMGEKSRLPVFQTIYSGSLKDVNTLDTTLSQLKAFAEDKPLRIVLDKGFFSNRNINEMYERKHLRWIVAVPFTTNLARKNVESERKDIDCITKTCVLSSDSVRAVTKKRSWNSKHQMFVHVFYNPLKAAKLREALFAHVAKLKDFAVKETEQALQNKECNKYLIIRRSSSTDTGYTISIRKDELQKQLSYAGWMVLASNDELEAKETLAVYREKDVVEKGFMRLKSSLNLSRLRVHSNERMFNKTFVSFISLILLSHIHQTMLEQDLYRKMTMKQMLLTLSKLRLQEIKDVRILFPLTKEQKEIFKAFDIKEPA
jgi:transposase